MYVRSVLTSSISVLSCFSYLIFFCCFLILFYGAFQKSSHEELAGRIQAGHLENEINRLFPKVAYDFLRGWYLGFD